MARLIEIHSGFHHSSDLDPGKPVNWKRQVKTCGEIGVMGDLGMHAVHVPFRLGWNPCRVYAQLQKSIASGRTAKGGMAPSDTWDNALLHTDVSRWKEVKFPLRFEMKRLSPGETDTWFIEILGDRGRRQIQHQGPKDSMDVPAWKGTDLAAHRPGLSVSVSNDHGHSIFEPGFPDCILQMWAAFLAERAGKLEEKFGCVTPDEAVRSHELFAAALRSQAEKRAIDLNSP